MYNLDVGDIIDNGYNQLTITKIYVEYDRKRSRWQGYIATIDLYGHETHFETLTLPEKLKIIKASQKKAA
jgi:hypothetical protein